MPRLVWARVRYALRAWLPTALAIGLALAVPTVTALVAQLTAAAALREGLAALPPGERSVTVSYNGILDRAGLSRLDALVTAALPRIGSGPVHRQMLYRPVNDGVGRPLVIAGADDLAAEVSPLSGRLPRSCTPQHCEVVLLRRGTSSGTRDLRVPPELGLVVVGEVERRDPLLLSGTFEPDRAAAVLVGDGVPDVASLAALSSFGRSSGWVSALDADRVHTLGAQAWLREGALVAQDLWRDGEGLVVTAPEDTVRDQARRAELSSRRFTLLTSAMAVLVLGAAAVGGASRRGDHGAWLRALARRGATRRQLAGATAAEVVAVAALAVLLGLVLAAGAAGVLGAVRGLSGALVAAAPVTLALLGAAGGLVAALLRWGSRVSAWHAVGLAASACAVASGLVVARGGVGDRASDGDVTLLGLLPALVLLGAGLALARAWPWLTRFGLRLLPRRLLAARLGVGAVAGRPLRPAATAALVTAAVASATFAGVYREVLSAGAADQAAHAVPLSARLTPGGTAQRPQDAAGPADLAPLGAFPVLKTVASVRVTASGGEPLQLVGLDPAALPGVARWGAVTGGGMSPQAVAAAISVPPADPGLLLPAGRRLVLTTTAPGEEVRQVVTATVRAADGRERAVAMRWEDGGDGGSRLTGDLPDLLDAAGAPARRWLIALAVRQPTDSADHRQHNLGEGTKGRAIETGVLALGTLSVDGAALTDPWPGGPDGAPSAAWRVAVRLDTGVQVLTMRPGAAPSSARPLVVVTDPQTAAQVSEALLDGVPLPVRVVGSLSRFPTVTGRFAIADLAELARVVDARTPGAAQASELWLRTEPPDTAPFDRLTVARRSVVEAGLRADPVARAASGLLVGVAGVVLLLALVSLVALVAAERREDAAGTLAREADGVAPATLRGALWWRAAAVAVPAVPAGVLAGVGLSMLATRLVAVTAVATAPQPPLGAGLDGVALTGWLALALGGVLVVALAVAGAVAWRSLREPLPEVAP